MKSFGTGNQSGDADALLQLQSGIISHIKEGFCLTSSRDSTIIYANPQFERMFGYAPGEMVGLPVAEVNATTDKSPEAMAQEIIAVLNSVGSWQGEIHNRRKDGATFLCDVKIMTYEQPEHGKVWLSVHNDITARKRAEQKILRLNAFYAVISQTNKAIARTKYRDTLLQEICHIATDHSLFMLSWIGLIDAELKEVKIVASSGAAAGYVDSLRIPYDADQPEGRGPAGTAIREDRIYVCNDIFADARSLPWRETASRYGIRSGAACPLRLNGQVVGVLSVYAEETNYFDHELTGLLADLSADISFALDNFAREQQRKQAEEILLQSQEEVAFLGNLLELSSQPLAIGYPDGRLGKFNPAFSRLIGYSGEEISKIDWAQELTPPEWLESERVKLEELHRTGLPVRYEKEYIHKDGTRVPIELFVHLVRDEEEKPKHYYAFITDITERKRAEAELIVAKERAEEAYKEKSAFLARMSHELRTPLNAILGFAQVMEADADTVTLKAHRDSLDTIMGSGWHLLRIIDDLLNLSAIDAGKVTLNLRDVEVAHRVRAGLKLLAPLAEERRVELSMNDAACEGVIIRADPFRLDQVLVNLIANAIKYNREGGSVKVSCQPTDGRIRILISDTGEGIADDELSFLFQPFSRLTQRPYTIQGAGIGLSVSKQLTELMGGTIGVESVVGKGSTFWIELPAVEASDAVSEALKTPHHPSLNEAPTGTRATLLYIEDNPVHIRLVEEIVSRISNLTLLTTHVPRIGIELARTRRPDLIIMDICLPGMNGYEGLQLLQADKRTCNIPVIAVSATASPAEIEKGLRAGFRRYLTKPLIIREFRTAIEELLRDAVRRPDEKQDD